MRAASFLAGVAFVSSLGLAACGEPRPSGPPEFEVEPGQIVTSASGRLVLSVWTAPAPPVKGVNALRLRIVDAAGAAVDGDSVQATTWMPAHGHAASVAPTVTPRGDGVYDLDRVVFFMDGRWELRGDATDLSGTGDAFLATFDVR
jgi:hypothetical protein